MLFSTQGNRQHPGGEEKFFAAHNHEAWIKKKKSLHFALMVAICTLLLHLALFPSICSATHSHFVLVVVIHVGVLLCKPTCSTSHGIRNQMACIMCIFYEFSVHTHFLLVFAFFLSGLPTSDPPAPLDPPLPSESRSCLSWLRCLRFPNNKNA